MDRDKILIVDDEEAIRTQLSWALQRDYEILLAGTPSQALELFKSSSPDLVLLDIALSTSQAEPDGLALLDIFLDMDPLVKIIMITGHDEKENALQAILRGAHDFYVKPIDLDEMKVMVKRGLYVQKLEKDNRALTEALQRQNRFEEIVGNCEELEQVYQNVTRVAPTSAPILIVGESGTGKELVAEAIHRLSSRRGSPFIVINCGAIPDNLLEPELFGHEEGAFTGAHIQRKGRFEMAQEGTIFLDEVGELSLPLQVKILRFLQEKEIERVGGREPIRVDARVIAATDKGLLEEVKQRSFREDLYYRLSVITIHLPPLRERGQDILLLARTFLHRFGTEHNKSKLTFSAAAEKALLTYPWPGNVRELENKVKRAVILSLTSRITPYDLGLEQEAGGKPLTLQQVREQTETHRVQEALQRHQGNITNAAKELGVSRTTLYDILEKYGLKKEPN